MLMQIDNLNVTLGGLHILHDVSLHVNEGELVVVVGANGAGKSTLLRTVSALNGSTSGTVLFEDKEIGRKKPHQIASEGLCLVPEGRQLFPELSARDNLLIGAYHYHKDKKRVSDRLEQVYTLFPVLKKYEGRIASTFSGGEQQMISIGRGLMSEPKLMMIDELSLGLAPLIIQNLFSVIKELNKSGMSILLIEQNARQALRIADRGYVLENGHIVLSGTGEELLNDDNVKEAYLGM